MNNGRLWENIAFLSGTLVLVFYGVLEALSHFGIIGSGNGGIPWGLLLAGVLLVMPKTIGKAQAGEAFMLIAKGIACRLGGKRKSTPTQLPPSE